jgi:hypothetical protein
MMRDRRVRIASAILNPHPHTAAEASLSAAALRIGEQGRQGRGRMNSTSTEHHPSPPRAPSTDLMAALAALAGDPSFEAKNAHSNAPSVFMVHGSGAHGCFGHSACKGVQGDFAHHRSR